MDGINLAKSLYIDISENDYLQELYEKLLVIYAMKTFHVHALGYKLQMFNGKEIQDLLRFADILSNSMGVEDSEKHHVWAQEIVILLARLYPNNENIQTFLTSTLVNTGNYESLNVAEVKPIKYSVMDNVAKEATKIIYAIPSSNNSFFLRPQKRMFDGFEKPSFSYSGPTSMGKTFLMRMYIKNQVIAKIKKNFAVIVPTKALINEISETIIKELRENLSEMKYRVETVAGITITNSDYNYIFVVTPERLLYLMLGNPHLQIDSMFIDEAYEISEKDSRSVFYYKIIGLIKARKADASIIFAAPNIPNPEIYLNLIPAGQRTEYFVSSYSPVCQMKIIIDKHTQKISVYNEYSSKFIEVCDNTVDNDVRLIAELSKEGQSIVYCNSREAAVKIAHQYKDFIGQEAKVPELEKLAEEIKSLIHEDYYLADLVRYGIAYHIAYLPQAVRKRIEALYKEGIIKVIFCTSTLLKGVNLPATNLFVTSHKNGRSVLSEVNFRNLIGRVGRLGQTLNGNVYLINEEAASIRKFKELLEKPVPEQKLSITTALNSDDKKQIVACLYKGDLSLQNIKFNNYEVARKFALILLKDILDDRHSYVFRVFAEFLNDEIIGRIKGIFSNASSCIDDDINTSADQITNLRFAISNGLCYPQNFDHGSIVSFLEKMADVFNWDLYETALVGNKKDEQGHRPMLRYYAVILSRWMRGERLSSIIKEEIKYITDNGRTVNISTNNIVAYNGSVSHKNAIIIEVLKVIEETVLFKLSGYFLRFSTEYKNYHELQTVPNDWYEYVEFGASDPLELRLQRLGYSRESAKYIKENRQKLLFRESLRYEVLSACDFGDVSGETNTIKLNNPEAFYC